jgi:hypothetical protein
MKEDKTGARREMGALIPMMKNRIDTNTKANFMRMNEGLRHDVEINKTLTCCK